MHHVHTWDSSICLQARLGQLRTLVQLRELCQNTRDCDLERVRVAFVNHRTGQLWTERRRRLEFSYLPLGDAPCK